MGMESEGNISAEPEGLRIRAKEHGGVLGHLGLLLLLPLYFFPQFFPPFFPFFSVDTWHAIFPLFDFVFHSCSFPLPSVFFLGRILI
jgi:hypothetical protein